MSGLTKWLRAVLAAVVLTWVAPSVSADQPHTLRMSETGSNTSQGTWIWDESRQLYVARWDNGAEAIIRLVRVTGSEAELARTDTTGDFKARYVGTRTGDAFRGTVEWTSGGQTWKGTWEGKLEVKPAAVPSAKPTPPAHALGPVLTSAQANDLFKRMAEQKDIAFAYPVDGCYARAHLMVQRMQALGAKPGKAWAFAPTGSTLMVRTPNHPDTVVYWAYHVAPTVRVRFNDGERDVVIDPSMFDRPATVEYWRDAMKPANGAVPFITKTRLGEAPLDASGQRLPGSGYTPGADPTDLDAHARRAMNAAFAILKGPKPWPKQPL